MYDFAKNALGSFELELAVQFLNPNICIELPTPALNHKATAWKQSDLKTQIVEGYVYKWVIEQLLSFNTKERSTPAR